MDSVCVTKMWYHIFPVNIFRIKRQRENQINASKGVSCLPELVLNIKLEYNGMHSFHIKSWLYWQGLEGDAAPSPPTSLDNGWKSVKWNKSNFGIKCRLRWTFLEFRQGSGSSRCLWLRALVTPRWHLWAMGRPFLCLSCAWEGLGVYLGYPGSSSPRSDVSDCPEMLKLFPPHQQWWVSEWMRYFIYPPLLVFSVKKAEHVGAGCGAGVA